MMKTALSRLALLSAIGLLAFGFLLTPQAAFAATHTHSNKIYAIPDSANGCVGNLPWNNVQTCFTIIGSGKYVQYMQVSAYVKNSSVKLALQMKGPNGFADYSGFVEVNPGTKVALRDPLNRNMPVGQYCGSSIVISGGGSGTACESVRA